MEKSTKLDMDQLMKIAGGAEGVTEGGMWTCPLCKQTMPKEEVLDHVYPCIMAHPKEAGIKETDTALNDRNV